MKQDATDHQADASPMWHACSFHESAEEQFAVALPFIEQGLKRGERCIVVAPAKSGDRWSRELGDLGLEHLDVAAFSFWTSQEWQAPGEFSSMRMAKHVWAIIEHSLDSHGGLRVAADMSWTHEAGVPSDKLCHWEATLDYLLSPNLPVQMLCLYDRGLLPCSTLHAGLRTHTVALAADGLIVNPSYEAAAILENEPDLNECSTDPEMVRRMLSQLLQSV